MAVPQLEHCLRLSGLLQQATTSQHTSCRKRPNRQALDAGVQVLLDSTEGYRGADLQDLYKEAAMTAARQGLHTAFYLAKEQFLLGPFPLP